MANSASELPPGWCRPSSAAGDRIYFPTRNRGVFVIAAPPEFKLLAPKPPQPKRAAPEEGKK